MAKKRMYVKGANYRDQFDPEVSTKAKLTKQQVVEIFLSPLSPIELESIYPVTRQHISEIKLGKKWSSVTKKLTHEGPTPLA